MSRPLPTSPYFALIGRNEHAQAAVHDPQNRVHFVPTGDGSGALGVGHIPPRGTDDPATLATIGRDGDIVLSSPSISKKHCIFTVNRQDMIVTLKDVSSSGSTRVGDSDPHCSYPFAGNRREIVVMPGVNSLLGLGGEHSDLFVFEIQWANNFQDTVRKLSARPAISAVGNGQWAETRLPSRISAIHTNSYIATRMSNVAPLQTIRYHALEFLGQGRVGMVFKAVDVDHSRLVAVKRIVLPPDGKDLHYQAAKGEVEALARIDHTHIVKLRGFVSALDGVPPKVKILMDLMDGDVPTLVRGSESQWIKGYIAPRLCRQILAALDFLETKSIVHGDVKPQNILFRRKVIGQETDFVFLLGDFGSTALARLAPNYGATTTYRAPELFTGAIPTSKSDCWSLYVTLLWATNHSGFQGVTGAHRTEIHRYVMFSMGDPFLATIQQLAREDPYQRASAAQMLVAVYNGKGLSTPRHQIPPLAN
ncbi:hypothetical protein ASPCAL04701 [Aspergillus calidoustus]|uniref:non-specific serine/threonine protein kinase n=1 Tax=Aspergillus calidoustus TaxID=454130 RepID=A0A0U5FVN8_ASPCI|nr:hypothetical protein ASPCAL04701 [Aspergillus calidoustus]